jgi:hypothetical protein
MKVPQTQRIDKASRQEAPHHWSTFLFSLLCGIYLLQSTATHAQEAAESAATLAGKKAGVALGKKAFDRGDLNTARLISVSPSDWKNLEKKYGEDGSGEYAEALSDFADQEFNRLVVGAAGQKPDKNGDVDKNEPTRVYYNVLVSAEQTIRQFAHDERSIRIKRPTGDYQLIRRKRKYAWGLTIEYTGKNAINATVKGSLNVYVANNKIVDVEEDAPSISQQILQSEFEKTASQNKKKK